MNTILRGMRRAYYFTFKMEYVMEQLKRRKGKCGNHGCCDLTLLSRLFSRNCFDREGGTMCKRWENLPFVCRAYPFDEKDKIPSTRSHCNFYWDEVMSTEKRGVWDRMFGGRLE